MVVLTPNDLAALEADPAKRARAAELLRDCIAPNHLAIADICRTQRHLLDVPKMEEIVPVFRLDIDWNELASAGRNGDMMQPFRLMLAYASHWVSSGADMLANDHMFPNYWVRAIRGAHI
jgi:hypothetical protein